MLALEHQIMRDHILEELHGWACAADRRDDTPEYEKRIRILTLVDDNFGDIIEVCTLSEGPKKTTIEAAWLGMAYGKFPYSEKAEVARSLQRDL